MHFSHAQANSILSLLQVICSKTSTKTLTIALIASMPDIKVPMVRTTSQYRSNRERNSGEPISRATKCTHLSRITPCNAILPVQEAGQRLESPEQTMHVNDKLRTRTHAGPRAQGPGANKYWHPPSTKRTGFRAQMVHVWLNDGLALACPPPLTLSLALSSDDVVSPCCRIPGSANPQTPNCVNETLAATASQRGPLERPAVLY